jgi:hypothetical protein
MTGKTDLGRWYLSKAFRCTACVLFAVILVIWFYSGVVRKHNDFRHHFRLGLRFLQGQPYLPPGPHMEFAHYPPGRLLLNAPLGVPPILMGQTEEAMNVVITEPGPLSYRISRGVSWTVSVVLLLWTLCTWHRMAGPIEGVERDRHLFFAATAFAIGLTLPWLTRDLDEAGMHIMLLAMLTGAAWWTMQRRAVPAGLMLALAATWKINPLLFVPLLAYKRRWATAGWAVVFVLVVNCVLPMVTLGWSGNLKAHEMFFAEMRQAANTPLDNPTATGVIPARHQNRSLRLAVCRCLQTYRPDGGPGSELFIAHPDDVTKGQPTPPDARPHPLFVQFLDLPGRTVSLIASGVTAVLLLLLAIKFRRRWGPAPTQADLPSEWAVAMVAVALISPYCWGQHLVLCIPAALLIMRDVLSRPQAWWRKVALAATVVLVLLPQKEVFGKMLWTVIHSYKPQTAACLLMIAMVLTIPRSSGAGGGEQEPELR